LPTQRPVGFSFSRFDCRDFARTSAGVHTFDFIAAAPSFAASRMARLLPFVVARPPTPNIFRHFQTTPALTPNQ
jgi:hypothetical protein